MAIDLRNEVDPEGAIDLSPDSIASEEVLRAERRTLDAMSERMTLVTLKTPQRQRLQALLSPEELALHIECQRFAQEEPELAEQAGCPPEEWDEIVEKDLALGQNEAALEPLIGTATDLGHILLHEISRDVDNVEDYAARAPGASAAERDRLRVKVGNAAQTHKASARRGSERRARQERRREGARALLAQAEGELEVLRKARRLAVAVTAAAPAPRTSKARKGGRP